MKNINSAFTILEHTADIGLKVYGSSLSNLFEEAVSAFISLLVKSSKTGFNHTTEFEIAGEDYIDLMIRCLSEILYLFEAESLIVNRIEIKSITSKKLAAILKITEFDPATHEIINNIKAATYHNASINKTDDGWCSIIYFDL